MNNTHLQGNNYLKEGDFMYAVDNKEHHFEGFIHAETLQEAKQQISSTDYRVHSVCKIK